MTRDIEKVNNKTKEKITFYESLTGQKYDQKDPKINYLYRRIGSVFNHEKLYANLQEEDSAYKTDFTFENPMKWKSMGDIRQFDFPSIQNIRALRVTSNIETILSEEDDIEYNLKEILRYNRETDGLITKFDDEMSYLQSVALSNYESDKLYGVTFSNEEFQAAIKKKVPVNHVFKAFPIQFTHKNPKSMFETMRRNPNCEEIIKANGDQMHFCLRTKIVNYFEDVYAVWVILGLRYIPI